MGEKEAPRSFVKFVDDLSDGLFAREAGEELFALGDALYSLALDTGTTTKGEIKVTFKIEVQKSGAATITPVIDVKRPKKPKLAGVMFMTKGGNFSATNPRQLELGKGVLREVPARARDEHEREDDAGTGSR